MTGGEHAGNGGDERAGNGGDERAEDRRLSSPGDRFGARLQRQSSAAALQARVIEQETHNLAEAFRLVVDDGSVTRAAATVVAARRRFVAGTGKAFAYASLLAADLSAGMSNVTLVDGAVVRPLDVLSDVRDSDVLVAVSLRRYRRETVAVAEQFAAAGGTVVAVTDAADAPLATVAAQAIVVPTGSASYADSPTAVAAVVHLLATLTTASAKGARRRLAERDRISRALDLYWEG
ncbi:DNA-binding MurR/RpiR family transcriptional regulator [Haloactinopolyspora alba]|uniref:DNA-binding MurR/RpiR family transcriptional regulator n=1 Tax=Haloactinopolyspora alba TaxID=648780 RepID=A0A2P8E5N7_9ACTN|nr:SIS domain-containing protein [Haloactinopolyspora alba]PSL04786.1 DNA-binding MurR/RpiR family transcriptional regulator [Haloactinopolyspora alba]